MTLDAPAVDSELARELLSEATRLGATDNFDDLERRLEEKVRLFQTRLNPAALNTLDLDGLREIAAAVFTVRSKRRRLAAKYPIEVHRREIRALLHGDAPLKARFDHFVQEYSFLKVRRAATFASELLHYTRPDQYWLWTPWIWDPSAGDGALRLITGDSVSFTDGSPAEVYHQVGKATALVARDGATAGYTRMGRGLLGTDLFLAVVSAVTLLTRYRVRISQEFLRFLPELSELTGRMLGVHHLAEVG